LKYQKEQGPSRRGEAERNAGISTHWHNGAARIFILGKPRKNQLAKDMICR